MFGIDSTEFLLIAIVALVVIGPKDLPRVMRMVGGWVGRGRAMTRHLRSGFDTMMREAELEEMQKQWAQQNADIMAATTVASVAPHVYDAPVVAHDDVAGSTPLADSHSTHADAIPTEPHAALFAPNVADVPANYDYGSGASVDHGGASAGGAVAATAAASGVMTGPRPSPAAILAHADVAESTHAATPVEPLPPTAAP